MDDIYTNKTIQPPIDQAFEVSVEVNGSKIKTTREEMRDFSNGIAQPNHEGGGCISFHNVSYTVEQRTCLKKRPTKVILNDVRSVEPIAAQYTCVVQKL